MGESEGGQRGSGRKMEDGDRKDEGGDERREDSGEDEERKAGRAKRE